MFTFTNVCVVFIFSFRLDSMRHFTLKMQVKYVQIEWLKLGFVNLCYMKSKLFKKEIKCIDFYGLIFYSFSPVTSYKILSLEKENLVFHFR